MKRPEPLISATIDSLEVITNRASNDRQAFLADEILQDAVLMRILEAGEYLSRIRADYEPYYDAHHTNAWSSLIGLRNIIAHGYVQVSREIVWEITQNNIPALISQLKTLL